MLKPNLTLFPRGGDLNLNFLFKGFKALKEAKIRYVCYSKAKEWNPHPTPLYLSNPPYLTLCRRKGGPKIFDSKYFADSNFFGPTIFWTPNVFGPASFWTQNCFGPQIVLGPKLFWTQNCFGPQIVLDPKFFLTQNFFGPKDILDIKLF